MRRHQILVWSIVIFVLAACDSDAPEPKTLPDLRPISTEEQLLIDNSNDLLFQSFRYINHHDPEKNTFFSPVSIGMALSMAYNGANNGTKESIGEISGINDFPEIQINKAYNDLIGFLHSLDENVRINLANSFWYEQNLPINRSYRDIVMAYYDAESEGIDFSNHTMTNYISRIIEAKSSGMIKNSIEEINKDHHSFIYNAACFNGQWAEPFDYIIPELSFENDADKAINCDYIFRKNTPLLYFEDEEKLITEISFGNRQFSSMIIMPKNKDNFNRLTQNIDQIHFSNWRNQLDTFNVSVEIPAFKVDYKVNLNNLFINMGLSGIFDKNADFTNIFPQGDKMGIDLYEHRSLMEFDTEYLPVIESSEMVNGNSFASIRINQPFFYFIREKHTGLILFAGKIINPVE